MILSFIFALFSILITYLCSNSFASFMMAGTTFVLGQIFCNIVQRENRDKAKILFNIVFSFLTIFACIHYMDTVVDWSTFAQDWRDEYKYWLILEDVKHSTSLYDVLEYVNERFSENNGHNSYIAILAYLAERYFDGNSLLLHFLGSALFGSLSSVVFFKILLLYFDKTKAMKNAIIFSLLSGVLTYGFNLVRDIHVYFFFLINTYILLTKFEVKKVIMLVLSCIILFSLRFESGMFALVFPIFYIYNKFKKNWLLLLLFIPIVMSIAVSVFMDNYSKLKEAVEFYNQSFNDVLANTDGLTKIVESLPPVIKEIFSFLQWIIFPFPSYNALTQSSNIWNVLTSILIIVYQFFHLMIMFLTAKWLLVNKTAKLLPSQIKYALIIGLALAFVSLSNMTTRRVLITYAIIYVAYLIIKEKLSLSVIKKDKMFAVVFYLFINILYLILKA